MFEKNGPLEWLLVPVPKQKRSQFLFLYCSFFCSSNSRIFSFLQSWRGVSVCEKQWPLGSAFCARSKADKKPIRDVPLSLQSSLGQQHLSPACLQNLQNHQGSPEIIVQCIFKSLQQKCSICNFLWQEANLRRSIVFAVFSLFGNSICHRTGKTCKSIKDPKKLLFRACFKNLQQKCPISKFFAIRSQFVTHYIVFAVVSMATTFVSIHHNCLKIGKETKNVFGHKKRH